MPAEPPFEQLAQLAQWHERKSDPLARPFLRGAEILCHMESAALFRRMIGNRESMDPARLRLSGPLPLDAPGQWCERHGYRCISGVGAVGVMAQRGDEPPIVARLGDTLLWDGARIIVQERADGLAHHPAVPGRMAIMTTERVNVRVLLLFGDQAEVVADVSPEERAEPERYLAADIAAATGVTVGELPGATLTAEVGDDGRLTGWQQR